MLRAFDTDNDGAITAADWLYWQLRVWEQTGVDTNRQTDANNHGNVIMLAARRVMPPTDVPCSYALAT
jgi:hypothetical protein